DPVADLGDRPDVCVAALVDRHEQDLVLLAHVDGERDGHVREDDHVFQRYEQQFPQVDTSLIVGTKKIPTRTALPPEPFPRPFRNEPGAPPMPAASPPLHRGTQAGSPTARERKTMSNDDLVTSVTEELYWDPKLDSSAIAVSANNGAVTLRGAV